MGSKTKTADIQPFTIEFGCPSQDPGLGAGEEGVYSPEKFISENHEYENIDFILTSHKGWSAKDETWEGALETIEECCLN